MGGSISSWRLSGTGQGWKGSWRRRPMPVESFPLPDLPPDPSEAARLLALTQTALEGPIAALSDAAGGGLTQTAGQLGVLRKRLLASAQSRLRATGRDLGQVLDKLHQGAQAALAETAASLSLTSQRAGRAPYGQRDTSADVYWTVIDTTDCSARVVPAPIGSPPEVTEPTRRYGPYQSDAQAQSAVSFYRTYLVQQGLCAGGGGGVAPVVDYWWVE